MRFLFCILFLVASAVVSFAGPAAVERVADPLKDFLGDDFHISKADEVLRLDMDINHDGKNDVFLTRASHTNGKAGNMWSVYKGVKGGYEYVGGMDFHPGFFYLGYIKRLRRYGLISYWPDSAQSGTFVAHTIRGGTVIDTEVESLSLHDSEERHDALTRKYFGKGPPFTAPVKVKEIPASVLAKKYRVQLE